MMLTVLFAIKHNTRQTNVNDTRYLFALQHLLTVGALCYMGDNDTGEARSQNNDGKHFDHCAAVFANKS
jgi:hypothetical protein